MSTLLTFCTDSLAALAAQGRGRALRETVAVEGAVEETQDGMRVHQDGAALVDFGTNDYLGLARDARVVAGAVAAAQRYGAGAGASRLLGGNHPLYAEVERQLAARKGTEGARVFGSGYLANLGAIAALAGPGDLILADRLAHACMLDGARLSGAEVRRFAHNSPEHLARLLRTHRARARHCLILTERVFSMDGDIAPLAPMAALAVEHDAWLYVDDAHGFGVLGPCALPGDVIWMGTLSKAVGVYGGYVAGPQALVAYITSTARSLLFTTALPPPVLGAATAALEVMAAEPERATRALAHAARFAEGCGLSPTGTTVVPWVLGKEAAALAAAETLRARGFLVPAIRPPTVPPQTARLRFSFSAAHTAADVHALVDAVRAVMASGDSA